MNAAAQPTSLTNQDHPPRCRSGHQRLNALAERTGRTKSFYLSEIIEQGMQDMEDCYLAADVLERVRKGEERVISSEELGKSLGLDD